MKNDEAGIKWLQGNNAGWANFLACLKARLEYSALDFMSYNNCHIIQQLSKAI
jgi:hypothetical protein